MKRIRQKCFVGSVGLHALLLVILLVAPAFLKKPEPKKERVPIKLIDGAVLAALSKAASAPAHVPSPAPARPAPVVQKETPKPAPPKAKTTPKPPVKKIEPKKPAPKKVESKKIVSKPKPKPRKITPKKPTPKPVIKPPTRSKPQPKPKPRVRKATPRPKPKIDVPSLSDLTPQRDVRAEQARQRNVADAARQAQAREDTRRRANLKRDLAKVFSGSKNYSERVTFKPSGGSSRSSMDYGTMLVKAYTRAWNPPAELAGRLHIITVSVTIAKSGRVTNKRIVKKSGISSVDRSVQATLDRETKFRAFPSGMTESQKTYTIDFNLQAK
jgi:TonB family protein